MSHKISKKKLNKIFRLHDMKTDKGKRLNNSQIGVLVGGLTRERIRVILGSYGKLSPHAHKTTIDKLSKEEQYIYVSKQQIKKYEPTPTTTIITRRF